MKDSLLLAFLREVPYLNSNQIWNYFYPENKTSKYSQEKTSYLIKSEMIEKYKRGDGNFIYYLTKKGHENAISTLWYLKNELKKTFEKKEKNSFHIFYPSEELEFKYFTPFFLDMNPIRHTSSMIEFMTLCCLSKCFLYNIPLDNCVNKKSRLNIPFNPDILLCNTLDSEEGRVFIEIENSKIRESALVRKLNNISKLSCDYIFVICTDIDFFINWGRTLRKVLSGEAKVNKSTLVFSNEARVLVNKKLLIGYWPPSFKNEREEISKIGKVKLYRYDNPVFDSGAWINKIEDGIPVKDDQGKVIKEFIKMPYSSRKGGASEFILGDIFIKYRTEFEAAQNKYFEFEYKL